LRRTTKSLFQASGGESFAHRSRLGGLAGTFPLAEPLPDGAADPLPEGAADPLASAAAPLPFGEAEPAGLSW